MPRLRKTDAQRRAERFAEHYRVGKARLELYESDIASALGIGEATLYRYKRNPDLFSIGQIVRLMSVFDWTDEQFLDIFGRGSKEKCGRK